VSWDKLKHFLTHVSSGRRLIDLKHMRCIECDGFGYPKADDSFIGTNLGWVYINFVYMGQLALCTGCNGTGKKEI